MTVGWNTGGCSPRIPCAGGMSTARITATTVALIATMTLATGATMSVSAEVTK